MGRAARVARGRGSLVADFALDRWSLGGVWAAVGAGRHPSAILPTLLL